MIDKRYMCSLAPCPLLGCIHILDTHFMRREIVVRLWGNGGRLTSLDRKRSFIKSFVEKILAEILTKFMQF